MSDRQVKLGVIGLGRAFMLMLPTLARHPRIRLVAAADPRPEARERFKREFDADAHASVQDLCASSVVDAVYVASPHQFHVEHVSIAARNGKHILVEKPIALTMHECAAMIEAVHRAGVQMVVGHSHSFDTPYLRTREIITSGALGSVRMITAMNFTDYLFRPRRPEELATELGGGAVFSQGAHHIDIVRLLGGGRVRSVRAATGAWDTSRPTEGAYSALLMFEDGVFASMTHSGYAHFDTDEFCDWVGELGQQRAESEYGAARRLLSTISTPAEEAALKNKRAYGLDSSLPKKSEETKAQVAHNHFGLMVVSCDKADLRPLPKGVMVYGNESRWLEPLAAPDIQRAEVIDEFVDTISGRRPALHTGESGMATVEICLALLESARKGQEVRLQHQVGVGE